MTERRLQIKRSACYKSQVKTDQFIPESGNAFTYESGNAISPDYAPRCFLRHHDWPSLSVVGRIQQAPPLLDQRQLLERSPNPGDFLLLSPSKNWSCLRAGRARHRDDTVHINRCYVWNYRRRPRPVSIEGSGTRNHRYFNYSISERGGGRRNRDLA
jgi:hypothetical protein